MCSFNVVFDGQDMSKGAKAKHTLRGYHWLCVKSRSAKECRYTCLKPKPVLEEKRNKNTGN